MIETASRIRPLLVDITGGAPELHPEIRTFISRLRDENLAVQLRTNLTALLEPECRDIPLFLKKHQVRIVASLPCYMEKNVNSQRGNGVFAKSINTIKMLNEIGYAFEKELPLNLVYNPMGAFLPPDQGELEDAYRKELLEKHGVRFTRLLTISNMPLGRFQKDLHRRNGYKEYIDLLKSSFNPGTIPGLMCRHQVSVGWDGTLYDCDFNLALGIPLDAELPQNIEDFDLEQVGNRKIATGYHCFGCCAGKGSSCRGALV